MIEKRARKALTTSKRNSGRTEEARESAKEEIGSSAKKLLNESAENVDECPSGARDDVLQKPTQLTLVDPNSLETGIIIQLCARNVVTLSSC